MNISQEDFQKARRISREIQSHLTSTGKSNVRSTDLYEHLARLGLIEKDRHQGLHFRSFLNKLREAGMLCLIPQCTHFLSPFGKNEWYFSTVSSEKAELEDIKKQDAPSVKFHAPKMPKAEIEQLIEQEAPIIQAIRKRPESDFTVQELEIRKTYHRAYEYWSDLEHEVMMRAYQQCGNIDAVASILQRQPHIVQERIAPGGQHPSP